MKKKKILLLLMAALLVITLSGCFDYRELNLLDIVTGFSIDRGTQGNYHLSFEVVNESGGESSGDSDGNSSESTVVESDGKTIFDAVRNAEKGSGYKLYFSHCEAIIISHQLASAGIAPLLSWINQDNELRLSLNLMISKANSAEEVLKLKSPLNSINSTALTQMLQDDAQTLSKIPQIQLYEANEELADEGVSLILPLIDHDPNQKKAPQFTGSALFKKDRLVGYLNADESQYLLMTRNAVKGGIIVLRDQQGNPGGSFEIKRLSTQIVPRVQKGKAEIAAKVQIENSLGEVMSNKRFGTQGEIQAIEQESEEQVKASLQTVIHSIQEKYDVDVFGFGRTISTHEPAYWAKNAAKWDTIFKTLPVQVSVEVKTSDSALAKSKIPVSD
ncbi:MAG TPA: hypothetical protein DEP42_01950 [Ruminococcaceae bacterium]|nr:hypothetical protein [Oscillospiraceae bacterium]